MVVRPDDKERVRIRIRQRFLAKLLECPCGGLRRVGREAVRDLETVDIRLMLEVPAVDVERRRQHEHHDRKQQDQDRE